MAGQLQGPGFITGFASTKNKQVMQTEAWHRGASWAIFLWFNKKNSIESVGCLMAACYKVMTLCKIDPSIGVLLSTTLSFGRVKKNITYI